MQISSQEFHHLIRVLHCIDGWEMDGILDHDQQVSLCRDPIRFFLACDDDTREKLWEAMLERHNRGYRGSRSARPVTNVIDLVDALKRTDPEA